MGKQRDLWNADSYQLCETGVTFEAQDQELQFLFDECERLCKLNINTFNDYECLVEGAGYSGVWLETQPMGGEMYAKRDMKVALNNILIFLRYQRNDGKFAGMIHKMIEWLGVLPNYDWMQGCFLPGPALKMYYHLGEDREYLKLLYDCLKAYDNFLWTYRDSTGDGCLENWCVWDVGEDNSTVFMLNGIKMAEYGKWGKSTPPENAGNLPHKSPQYMAYSYACRDVLAKISKILDNGEEVLWREKAKEVQRNATKHLWDPVRHAYFIKDKDGKVIDALTQENIKCMYCGLFTEEQAEQFVNEHLLNEKEFWTPVPLPAIAANDPYFHVNEEYSNCLDRLELDEAEEKALKTNSWSGPNNGLIWQRSIEALLNYGFHAETVLLGKKILDLLKEKKKYVQNYNPFTGEPAPSSTGYGPTMLTALEYISILCGVNFRYDQVMWSCAEGMGALTYVQKMHGKEYTLKSDGVNVKAMIDDRVIFNLPCGCRVFTDFEGNIRALLDIGENQEIYLD